MQQNATTSFGPIRKLRPDEIEIRVGQVLKNSKRASFLLYKNARVDMQILDELVGPLNWTREHKELKGIIYCGVGIRTDTSQPFVTKWDCGTQSNTDPEKGEASDSFKRACVNIGIGRELYTAPQIWLDLTEKEWNDGRPRVKFQVASIDYDDETGAIKSLVITDENLNTRFSWGDAKAAAASAPQEGAKGVETKTLKPGTASWKSLVETAKKKGYTRVQINDSIQRRGYYISKEDLSRLYVETDAA